MANPKSYVLVMATLIVVGTQILSDQKVSAKCSNKIPKLITQCAQFIQKKGPQIPPCSGCCQVLTNIDIPYVCKYVTPNVEKLISMEKAMYVAKTCGIEVVPGAKCGSYTTFGIRTKESLKSKRVALEF